MIGLADVLPDPDGSVIQFDPMVFKSPQTITLTSTLVLSAGPVLIDGPGASIVTVSGNNAVEVFSVTSDVTATLTGLTISGGNSFGEGGGINNAGTMTVTDSTIDHDMSEFFGGGIYNSGTMAVTDSAIADESDGGIYNSGTMTITDSTIDHNSGDYYGTCIDNVGNMAVTYSTVANNSAWAIINQSTLTLTGSTIANNSGIGVFSSTSSSNPNTLTVIDSTISDNSDGGIFNTGPMTITDSTIAGNTGADLGGGGIYNQGTTTITNSTIAYNNSPSVGGDTGGGLNTGGGTTTLYNTIIALNTRGTGGDAVADDISLVSPLGYVGTVSSSSAFNLIGTGGSGGLTNGTNHNQVGVANPGLGPLADNGGPTQTIKLLPGSPAINKGSNALAVDPLTGQPLATDQRGPGFVRIVNGTVDIGAYEYTPDANDTLAVTWGTQTATLQTAADGLRLLPAGRTTDIPWLGIDKLPITLSQAYTLSAGRRLCQ